MAHKAGKVVLVVVVLAVVLGAILQLTLGSRLADRVTGAALPAVARRTGVNISVERARVNLLGRSIHLSGVRVENPPGFDEPTVLSARDIRLKLRILPLLRGVVWVSRASAKGAVMTITRNAKSEVNTRVIHNGMDGTEKAGASSSPVASGTEQEASPRRLPGFFLERLALDAQVNYVDHRRPDEPLRLAFDVSIAAHDVGTVSRAGSRWGAFTVRGHAAEAPDTFRLDLSGQLAPLTDPLKPSFELQGTLDKIDATVLSAVFTNLDVRSDNAEIETHLVSSDGVLEKSVSTLALRLQNARLTGKLRKKAGGFALPPDFTVTAPVGGPIDSPSLDYETALLRAALAAAAENPEFLAKAIKTDNKDAGKAISNAFKALGGLLNSRK